MLLVQPGTTYVHVDSASTAHFIVILFLRSRCATDMISTVIHGLLVSFACSNAGRE